MNIKPSILQIGWILLLILSNITSIKADEWAVDGSVRQFFSYDDNIGMKNDPTASAIYKITPKLNFYRRTETTEIAANASYGIERFSNTTQFDSESQQYGMSGLFRTIKSIWRLNANYSILPLRDVAEQDTGNFGSIAIATTRSISPYVAYQLTEQDSFYISATFSDTDFETSGSANFNDRENRNIDIGWTRQWTKRYTASISLFNSNFESINDGTFFDVITMINTSGINVTNDYKISEKWSFLGTIGIRMTQTETEFKSSLGKSKTTFDSNGFLADIKLIYAGQNLYGDVRFNRELIPSSQGRLNEQSRLSSSLNYKLTERFSTNLFLSYQLSESASTESTSERTNFQVKPSVSWKVTPEWLVSASYRYRKQEEETGKITTRDATSNLFMLSLYYNWQGLSLSR